MCGHTCWENPSQLSDARVTILSLGSAVKDVNSYGVVHVVRWCFADGGRMMDSWCYDDGCGGLLGCSYMIHIWEGREGSGGKVACRALV